MTVQELMLLILPYVGGDEGKARELAARILARTVMKEQEDLLIKLGDD